MGTAQAVPTACAYGRIYAATALGNDLHPFTRNPDAVDHLGAVGLEVHTV